MREYICIYVYDFFTARKCALFAAAVGFSFTSLVVDAAEQQQQKNVTTARWFRSPRQTQQQTRARTERIPAKCHMDADDNAAPFVQSDRSWLRSIFLIGPGFCHRARVRAISFIVN